MITATRIDKKTHRVTAINLEAHTFEEERILEGLLKLFALGGTCHAESREGEILASFSMEFIQPDDGSSGDE